MSQYFNAKLGIQRVSGKCLGHPNPQSKLWNIPQKLWCGAYFHTILHVCEEIMNAVKYQQVMETRAIPQMAEWFPNGNGIFMHNAAPCHTAKLVKEYLANQNQAILPWPANSPDINPIENMWAIIKRKIKKNSITTKQQLTAALIRHWVRDAALIDTLHSRVESMPRRIAAVIKAKGENTKYWNSNNFLTA